MRMSIISHGLSVAGGKSVGLNIISELLAQNPEFEFQFFLPDLVDYCQLPFTEKSEVNIYTKNMGILGRIFYDSFVLPKKIADFSPDFIFALGNIGLRKPPCPQAILYHKPHFVYPELEIQGKKPAKNFSNRLISWQLKHSFKNSELIFCQTEVMKQRVEKYFKFKKNLALLPNSVSENINLEMENKNDIEFNDNKTRFLCLTRYYPHKNLEAIVKCFDKYRDELRNVVCLLTIDKSQHKDAAKLLKNIADLGLEENIVNLGPVKQEHLANYYRSVSGLLLPTLMESFSGTYVEALSFGCPVLTSDRDFAHVICGEAAIYFDPLSEESMYKSIQLIVDNQQITNELVSKGKTRHKELLKTWNSIVSDAVAEIKKSLAST